MADGEKAGRFGPADRQELLDDYCQLAIYDQESAGLDILTDGEHRRGGWIEGITGNMAGLALKPSPRKLGAIGWDQLPVYEVREPLDGRSSRSGTTRPSTSSCAPGRTGGRRSACPGRTGSRPSWTSAPSTAPGASAPTRWCPRSAPTSRSWSRRAATTSRSRSRSPRRTPAEDRTPENLVETINQVVDGITGCTFIVHICFGSFRRLPYAKRTYRWLFPALLDANVHGFSLEFGAREMAEIDLVGKWDRDRILSAGLIDIKTHYSETPEDIIERVRTCLEYRDPERLEISTDCGLRRVPRYLAMSKMSAAAEAARRLRETG